MWPTPVSKLFRKEAFRFFSKLFQLISTAPLSVPSEVINSAYVKIIRLKLSPENV